MTIEEEEILKAIETTIYTLKRIKDNIKTSHYAEVTVSPLQAKQELSREINEITKFLQEKVDMELS